MAFQDREAEQAALRQRLLDVVDELRKEGITRLAIAREAGRSDWSTIYRQTTGEVRPDPLVVEKLEASLQDLRVRQARTRFSAGVPFRMVPVIGRTGPGARIAVDLPSLGEVPVMVAVLRDPDLRWVVVEVGEDSKPCGVVVGDSLLVEWGGAPQAGDVVVVEVDGVPGVQRYEHPKGKARGPVVLGVARKKITVADL